MQLGDYAGLWTGSGKAGNQEDDSGTYFNPGSWEGSGNCNDWNINVSAAAPSGHYGNETLLATPSISVLVWAGIAFIFLNDLDVP